MTLTALNRLKINGKNIQNRVEKSATILVFWTFAFSFPIWIYGMSLAISRIELKPILAMTILLTISGFCFWKKIGQPLKNKITGTQINEK